MRSFFKFLSLFLVLVLSTTMAFADTVFFNTKTRKMHKQSCSYAQACTVNCIKIEKSLAVKKGGIPCKKCGG